MRLSSKFVVAGFGETRFCSRLAVVSRLLTVLILLFCSRSEGHQMSDSFLVLQVTNSQIFGHWDIALKDLLHARGLDPLDQKFTDLKAFDPERELTNANVLSRLKIRIDGEPAQVKPVDFSMELYNDGPYAVLYFEIPTTNPKRLEVQYRLFVDVDPAHRGLMRLQTAGKTISAVFSPAQPVQQFELSAAPRASRLFDFIRLGVFHIWTGIDHILFLVALLLPSVLRWESGRSGAGNFPYPSHDRAGNWQVSSSFHATLISVLKIVTAFTIAHSVTLSLAAFKIVHLNSRVVEVIIALSVAFAALNNIFALLPHFGWAIAFSFGFIHGFGFANVLADLGLERGNLALPLIGFNTGVELGQLAIVGIFLPLAFRLRSLPIYRVGVFKFGSLLITALAAIWACERMFDWKLLPF